MILEKEKIAIPTTLAEFMRWEPEDGFKYEWNDGELIKFTSINKKQFHIFGNLNRFFIKKGYWQKGTLITEQDVQLTGIQMRRPDIAYFTIEQEQNMKNGNDEIPEFVIEILSENDNIQKVEDKVTEYFKAGVKVLWHIFPEQKIVYVYTSRREVKICIENDICSAKPVLDDFEIGVEELLA